MRRRDENEEYEYTVELAHLDMHNASGFCYELDCPCHKDKAYIENLNGHVQNGLASPSDANKVYKGQTIW